MKRLLEKFLIIIIVFAVFCCLFITNSMGDSEEADSSLSLDMDSIFSDADSFLAQRDPTPPIDSDSVKNTSDLFYNTLLSIGIVTAVVVGTILGIKFFISSIEEKSKIKQVLISYFVGCIILFGTFGIWKIVVTLLDDTVPTPDAIPLEERPASSNGNGNSNSSSSPNKSPSSSPSSSPGQSSSKNSPVLALNKKLLTLTSKSQKFKLKLTNTKGFTNITWKTSNSNVATVKNGTVTAKFDGTCTITVKAKNSAGKNVSASCTVKVAIPKTVTAFLNHIKRYNNQIVSDYKNKNYWEYSNNHTSQGEKATYNTFNASNNGQKTINCARIAFWAYYDMGITSQEDIYFLQSTGNLKISSKNLSRLKKYAKVIKKNKTVSNLLKSGELKKGDICGYAGHTNVYIGNKKWYDAGRGSGGGKNLVTTTRNGHIIYRFKTTGPSASAYLNTKVTYIIRLKNQS